MHCFNVFLDTIDRDYMSLGQFAHSVGLSELQKSIELGEYEWPISNYLTGLFLNLFEAKPKAVANFSLLRNN
jgi:hypothetical protein